MKKRRIGFVVLLAMLVAVGSLYAYNIRCGGCNGSGRKVCGTCGGDGRVVAEQICYKCSGKGRISCNSCGGDGYR